MVGLSDASVKVYALFSGPGNTKLIRSCNSEEERFVKARLEEMFSRTWRQFGLHCVFFDAQLLCLGTSESCEN